MHHSNSISDYIDDDSSAVKYEDLIAKVDRESTTLAERSILHWLFAHEGPHSTVEIARKIATPATTVWQALQSLQRHHRVMLRDNGWEAVRG